MTMNTLGRNQDTLAGIHPQCSSQAAWTGQYWAFIVSLAHPSEPEERLISGLDTRGLNSAITFETTSNGTATANQSLVWAKCKSTLRIGAGYAIEIVQ